MNLLDNHIAEYLEYCQYRKHLDPKTLKAYRIDLTQYAAFSPGAADALSQKHRGLFYHKPAQNIQIQDCQTKNCEPESLFSLS